MFPDALTPDHCLTGHGVSGVLWVWVLFWMTIVVGLQYIVIIFRWYYTFRRSWIQVSLMAIFLLCAIGSYWTFNAAFFAPNLAYTLKLLMLFVLCFCNLVFTVCSFGKRFMIESAHHEVGRRVVRLFNQADAKNKDVHQLADELREIVAEMRMQ